MITRGFLKPLYEKEFRDRENENCWKVYVKRDKRIKLLCIIKRKKCHSPYSIRSVSFSQYETNTKRRDEERGR